ncbi:MAG: hypothetical protein DLM59_12145 [Pseudonocardiales bacterium]|nr:MAG: hypothetical protein DLM59_12145 [Pseudonocardiales bacterium]
MPAYVISEVEILDESQGSATGSLPRPPSLARRPVHRSWSRAKPEVPEGAWPAGQGVVVVEFPSMDRLRSWYASADYAEALAVRETALTRRLLFVPASWTPTQPDASDRPTAPLADPLAGRAKGPDPLSCYGDLSYRERCGWS